VVDLVLKIGGVRECFTGVEREGLNHPYYGGGNMLRSTFYRDTVSEARSEFDFTTKVTSMFDCNKEGRAAIWEEPTGVEPGQLQYT
jgi:hypothetical protein